MSQNSHLKLFETVHRYRYIDVDVSSTSYKDSEVIYKNMGKGQLGEEDFVGEKTVDRGTYQ